LHGAQTASVIVRRDGKAQRCAIAVMAKAPRAGRVKTRLSPFLNPDEARDLGCCFLADVTANLALAARQAPIDPFVAFAPAGTEQAFSEIVPPGTGFVLADGIDPAPPGIAGFGRCLFQAADHLLGMGYGAVGLLNSDSPTLPTAVLVRAAAAAAERADRVVLGPSLDGGYYLIVVRKPEPRLFAGIEWSTDRVAAQTRLRAQEVGLDILELEPWYDVDDAASLQRLIAELDDGGTGSYPASATARWLRENRMAARFSAPASVQET